MLTAVQLGRRAGMRVSQLCLGTMNFGVPGKGHQGDWTLPIEEARPIFKAAMDHGLFYFDCADVYGIGASEEVVGRILRESFARPDYVLATKISMPMGRGANMGGLSRKHVREGIDACLQRLGHDYVDHLVIHRHPHGIPGQVNVPIEETLQALDDAVRAGKVLYLGASSMFSWQFVELQLTARLEGLTPFISMQNHYNLVYREEEREMIPYCESQGIAVTPWSPLARGILTGATPRTGERTFQLFHDAHSFQWRHTGSCPEIFHQNRVHPDEMHALMVKRPGWSAEIAAPCLSHIQIPIVLAGNNLERHFQLGKYPLALFQLISSAVLRNVAAIDRPAAS